MSDYRIPERAQQLYVDIQPEQLRFHQRRVALTKEFTFDAAHHLHLYEGKCKSLHGHTYRLVITISGIPNHIGLVLDFADLKEIFKQRVEAKLDHHYLNEVLPPMNTTAENMIVWIWEELRQGLTEFDAKQSGGTGGTPGEGLRLEELTLYETPTSSATLKREWMTP